MAALNDEDVVDESEERGCEEKDGRNFGITFAVMRGGWMGLGSGRGFSYNREGSSR